MRRVKKGLLTFEGGKYLFTPHMAKTVLKIKFKLKKENFTVLTGFKFYKPATFFSAVGSNFEKFAVAFIYSFILSITFLCLYVD